VDCRIGGGDYHSHGPIRILTLKGIHAEGLQQRRNKEIKTGTHAIFKGFFINNWYVSLF
jgi:hypothetical protein